MSAVLFAGSAWLAFVGACLLLAAAGLLWVAAALVAAAIRWVRLARVEHQVAPADQPAGVDEPTVRIAYAIPPPDSAQALAGRRMIRRHRQGVRS